MRNIWQPMIPSSYTLMVERKKKEFSVQVSSCDRYTPPPTDTHTHPTVFPLPQIATLFLPSKNILFIVLGYYL